MKIAVCGSAAQGSDEEILKKAFEIGKEIAENKAIVVTGATIGYSLEAAKGAASENGKVIGISPAKDEEEHISKYDYPTKEFTEIKFTNLGIPRRNYEIIEASDAVVFIGGQIGTLNEFTIAFVKNKIIGILENSGGIIEIIDKIAEICKKEDEGRNIIYSSKPKELVEKVINKFHLKITITKK